MLIWEMFEIVFVLEALKMSSLHSFYEASVEVQQLLDHEQSWQSKMH